MSYTRLSAVAGALLVPALAAAQAAPAPATPADCREALRQEIYQYTSAERSAGRPPSQDSVMARVRRGAAACVARFDAEKLDPALLKDLALLQLDAGNGTEAAKTLDRGLARPGLTDSARAMAMLEGMQMYLGTGAEYMPQAEALAARVDALANVPVQRVMAQSMLAGYYSSFDIDDKLGASSRAILAAVKQLPAAQQPGMGQAVVTAIGNLASLEANELRPDSALAILRRAPSEFPALTGLADAFKDDIARYSLVGTKATPLNADYWLNLPAGAPSPAVTGGVSVIVFTANWCHSCRESYPALTKLSKELAGRGLHVMFAVNLDGQWQGAQVSPEQEVERNREYFVKEHGFGFPIAIQRQEGAGAPPAGASNAKAYALRALPQFVVVDKGGTIRAILMGWDPSGRREQALTTVVNRALKG